LSKVGRSDDETTMAPQPISPLVGRAIAYGPNAESLCSVAGLGVDPRLKAEDDEEKAEDDERRDFSER
jgi:hypothetical protein